jgi:hypothetical protein
MSTKVYTKRIKVNIFLPKQKDRSRPLWYYNKPIAAFENGKMKLIIYAVGDIALRFQDNGRIYKNVELIYYAHKLQYTDKHLDIIIANNNLIENNYFGFGWVENGKIRWVGDISNNYDEAIDKAKDIFLKTIK